MSMMLRISKVYDQKRFPALLAASSVKMNTVQCVPVKYNTFVVYNKDS